jgi:hypothetical protein
VIQDQQAQPDQQDIREILVQQDQKVHQDTKVIQDQQAQQDQQDIKVIQDQQAQPDQQDIREKLVHQGIKVIPEHQVKLAHKAHKDHKVMMEIAAKKSTIHLAHQRIPQLIDY